jgi:hypothetical protein
LGTPKLVAGGSHPLGSEGFSDERIDELADAFVTDRIGDGSEQFISPSREAITPRAASKTTQPERVTDLAP